MGISHPYAVRLPIARTITVHQNANGQLGCSTSHILSSSTRDAHLDEHTSGSLEDVEILDEGYDFGGPNGTVDDSVAGDNVENDKGKVNTRVVGF